MTPLRGSTFCLVQLSVSGTTGVCIVLGGWRFVGRFGGGQAAVPRVYVGGKWGNLWHACTHWQICTCRLSQKLLTNLCRQEEAGAQTHACTPATKTVTRTQKDLEKDRIHLATRRILARIKSALQRSRKQKHSQRRRREPLDSQNCHLQTERRSGREGEGGSWMERRKRVEFSGVVTGRCVQIGTCVRALSAVFVCLLWVQLHPHRWPF